LFVSIEEEQKKRGNLTDLWSLFSYIYFVDIFEFSTCDRIR
jgi:hypothetical protein